MEEIVRGLRAWPVTPADWKNSPDVVQWLSAFSQWHEDRWITLTREMPGGNQEKPAKDEEEKKPLTRIRHPARAKSICLIPEH